ncbi:MAG: hypothetical protein AAFV95_10120 [Bacteroidota bacterium]
MPFPPVDQQDFARATGPVVGSNSKILEGAISLLCQVENILFVLPQFALLGVGQLLIGQPQDELGKQLGSELNEFSFHRMRIESDLLRR